MLLHGFISLPDMTSCDKIEDNDDHSTVQLVRLKPETKSILHMYCYETRKSHPRTRIIRQKLGAEFLMNYSGPRVGFPCPTTIHHGGYFFSPTF